MRFSLPFDPGRSTRPFNPGRSTRAVLPIRGLHRVLKQDAALNARRIAARCLTPPGPVDALGAGLGRIAAESMKDPGGPGVAGLPGSGG
jgi:hypothetical protein